MSNETFRQYDIRKYQHPQIDGRLVHETGCEALASFIQSILDAVENCYCLSCIRV